MTETLKSEFNTLIQEISEEVMELTVTKSIQEASYAINEHTPVLEEKVSELNKILIGLKQVNKQIEDKVNHTELAGLNKKLIDISTRLEKYEQDIIKEHKQFNSNVKLMETRQMEEDVAPKIMSNTASILKKLDRLEKSNRGQDSELQHQAVIERILPIEKMLWAVIILSMASIIF